MNGKVTIWHNNKCSTSRKILEALKNSGYEIKVIDYLKTPPSPEKIRHWLASGGVSVKTLLRKKESLYKELSLDGNSLSSEELTNLIQKYPVLMERPVIETESSVFVARPADEFITRINERKI